MQGLNNSGMLLAQGVQFKVLAHVFPVLRHDAIKPISNATMAAAMLQRRPESITGEAAAARDQRLMADIEAMLDESVQAIRLLADWLSDSGKRAPAAELLAECRKLLFTQMVVSGKQIVLPETMERIELPLYASRYIILAWLLYALEGIPAASALCVDASVAGQLRTKLPAACAAVEHYDAPQPILRQEASDLAAAYGWSAQCTDDMWILTWPGQGGR